MPPKPDAYVTALRLLAGRDLSATQIGDRLERRGCGPTATRAAIERLTREGLVDDRRVAHAWARTLLLVRRRGPLRAERELEARGIDRPIARDAVRRVLDETDEATLIEQALARRVRRAIRTTADLRRAHASLIRQGFSPDLIRQTLLRAAKAGRSTG